MTIEIQAPALEKVYERMQKYPEKLDAGMREAMGATLLVMWENVPPYPPEPETSDYTRTGTLGRTLGAGVTGGKAGGKPEIYETKSIGGGVEGRFGTRLNYAPYVIGDGTQAKHMAHWWTLSVAVEKAQDKITRVWNALGRAMAKWMEGQGE